MTARAVLLAACLGWGGCSYTFDSSAPDVPLIGDAPLTDSLPRLNRGPASALGIIIGVDKKAWLELIENLDQPDGSKRKGTHVMSLSPPGREEFLYADEVIDTYLIYYLIDRSLDPTTPVKLTYHIAGDPKPNDVFELPGGPGFFLPMNVPEGFLYFQKSADTKDYVIQLRDRSFSRKLPVPDGADPANPDGTASFVFSYNDNWLFVRDAKGELIQHSTRMEKDIDLGKRPPIFYEYQGRILTCGPDGLRTVSLDGKVTETIVDGDNQCDHLVSLRGNTVYYSVLPASRLLRVPLDGSAKPVEPLAPQQRLLTFGPKDVILYSLDPSNRYVHGAGDGWLGDWRFMNRGLDVRYSTDQKKLRWLENAAQNSGVGDLLSAPLNGTSMVLARNVRDYEELDDGRVLANSNRAFRGIQNRLITIDEDKREARWVADGAVGYAHLAGTNDVLVELLNQGGGFDLVRVTIPPKP